MIQNFKDYIVVLYGTLLAFFVSLMTIALNVSIKNYIEKNAILTIFICFIVISFLFREFKKAIGIKLDKKILECMEVKEIQEKFEKRIRNEHSDVSIYYNIQPFFKKLIFLVINFFLILVLFIGILPIIFLVGRNVTAFICSVDNLHSIPVIVGGISMILVSWKILYPLFNLISENLLKLFDHTVEFSWNFQIFSSNFKECHTIFDSKNNQILIKFFDDRECQKVEGILRDIGFKSPDDLPYR